MVLKGKFRLISAEACEKLKSEIGELVIDVLADIISITSESEPGLLMSPLNLFIWKDGEGK